MRDDRSNGTGLDARIKAPSKVVVDRAEGLLKKASETMRSYDLSGEWNDHANLNTISRAYVQKKEAQEIIEVLKTDNKRGEIGNALIKNLQKIEQDLGDFFKEGNAFKDRTQQYMSGTREINSKLSILRQEDVKQDASTVSEKDFNELRKQILARQKSLKEEKESKSRGKGTSRGH